MGPFNNREIAAAFWFLVFIALALRRDRVRRSIAALVRAFCRPKILTAVGLMLLYSAGAVAVLATFGLWGITLLKDTIAWFCFSAIAMMVRFVTAKEAQSILRKVLVDSVKVVVLLEFLVNTYTFSLPVELIVVPLVTVLAMLDAVAGSDEKYSAVARLTKAMQPAIGLVILAIAVGRAVSDMRNLQSPDTLRSIALAPLLCVFLCPFLYLTVLVARYESVFVRVGFGLERNGRLKRYARRRIIMHAGLSLKRLERLLRTHALGLMHVQTKSDVDSLFQPSTDS